VYLLRYCSLRILSRRVLRARRGDHFQTDGRIHNRESARIIWKVWQALRIPRHKSTYVSPTVTRGSCSAVWNATNRQRSALRGSGEKWYKVGTTSEDWVPEDGKGKGIRYRERKRERRGLQVLWMIRPEPRDTRNSTCRVSMPKAIGLRYKLSPMNALECSNVHAARASVKIETLF